MRNTLLLAALTMTAGCGVVVEDDPTATTTASVTDLNGLDKNGAFTSWFDADPLRSANFMKYLVRCAYPAGRTFFYDRGGQLYSWDGRFGLAPNWSTGAQATVQEQEIVSACILAHINAKGTSVMVSFRNPNYASLSADPTERSMYPMLEGAFAGNLFLAAPTKYTCGVVDGSGVTYRMNTTTGRSCTGDNSFCGLTFAGQCKDICADNVNDTGFASCAQGNVREVVTTYIPTFCGDGVCRNSENCNTCPMDCPICKSGMMLW